MKFYKVSEAQDFSYELDAVPKGSMAFSQLHFFFLCCVTSGGLHSPHSDHTDVLCVVYMQCCPRPTLASTDSACDSGLATEHCQNKMMPG